MLGRHVQSKLSRVRIPPSSQDRDAESRKVVKRKVEMLGSKTIGNLTAGHLRLGSITSQADLVGWQSESKSRVSIYVCGVTVHDSYHVGHLRMLLSFEVIIRWLRQLGYSTFLVRNITDLADRTLQLTIEKGDFWVRTETMVDRLEGEMGPLRVDCPDWEPRVTRHIRLLQKLVRKLVKLKAAQPTASGDVLFQPKPRAAQVESGPHFSVWKSSPEGKRQLGWLSPYGLGKPGWHLECSTMCYHSFGWGVSLHGGGQDLRFPHHQNEMELNSVLFSEGYVRRWVHNGLVSVGDAKMSDSASNARSVGPLLEEFSLGAVRLFILSSHYSSPLEYGQESLPRFERICRQLRSEVPKSIIPAERWCPVDWNERRGHHFWDWMNQDVSTPPAISMLLSSFRSASNRRSIPLLRQCVGLAGIIGLDVNHLVTAGKQESLALFLAPDLLVESHILSRCWARTCHHYSLADNLRTGLERAGTVLTDNQNISDWSWCSASVGH